MVEIFTNSMLKDWQLCQQKYYYKYIRKIFIPTKEENFALGKKVHALINYKLNNFDMDLMEKTANQEVLHHYHSLLKHPLLQQKCFLSEWGFSVNIKDTQNLFMGRIDAIFFDEKSNKYTIADWKTGMKIPENPILDLQAQIYLYAFLKAQKDLNIEIKAEDLKFTFVKSPDLQETSINFSQELFEKFENNFIKTINEIQKYKHSTIIEEKNHCKFCEYKFICQKQ